MKLKIAVPLGIANVLIVIVGIVGKQWLGLVPFLLTAVYCLGRPTRFVWQWAFFFNVLGAAAGLLMVGLAAATGNESPRDLAAIMAFLIPFLLANPVGLWFARPAKRGTAVRPLGDSSGDLQAIQGAPEA